MLVIMYINYRIIPLEIISRYATWEKEDRFEEYSECCVAIRRHLGEMVSTCSQGEI